MLILDGTELFMINMIIIISLEIINLDKLSWLPTNGIFNNTAI